MQPNPSPHPPLDSTFPNSQVRRGAPPDLDRLIDSQTAGAPQGGADGGPLARASGSQPPVRRAAGPTHLSNQANLPRDGAQEKSGHSTSVPGCLRSR